MVRNSVAIQRGSNPACAHVEFARPEGADGAPRSFFPEQGEHWFWPAHGALVDGALVVFLQRIAPDASEGGLGFRVAGWTAVRVAEPSAPPEQWELSWLRPPDTGEYGLVGAAVLVRGEHVYAYAVREPTDHALALLRWKRADFTKPELPEPERFERARGYGSWPASALLADAASELSVGPDPNGAGFVLVQSRGFGAASIGLRHAGALEGPWSGFRELYRPPEAGRPNVLVYAARAHEELRGAELVITYASNSLDPSELMNDASIYFPRFVRAGRGHRQPPQPCEPWHENSSAGTRGCP
jgi:hypothetical protein